MTWTSCSDNNPDCCLFVYLFITFRMIMCNVFIAKQSCLLSATVDCFSSRFYEVKTFWVEVPVERIEFPKTFDPLAASL